MKKDEWSIIVMNVMLNGDWWREMCERSDVCKRTSEINKLAQLHLGARGSKLNSIKRIKVSKSNQFPRPDKWCQKCATTHANKESLQNSKCITRMNNYMQKK